MMLIVTVLCFVLAINGEEKYRTSEDFNITELLENDRLLVSYIKCFLDQAPCTAAVKEVKDKLPEALQTKCARCTDEQKQLGKQLVREVKKRHPDLWEQLTLKYDREGKHRQAFQEFLQA